MAEHERQSLPASLPDAFYIPADDGSFNSTRATASPWDAEAQHGGPPTALLAHVCRRLDPQPDLRLARITVEILRPIPAGRVRVAARLVRPGRRVRLFEAELIADGHPVALARVWEIAAAQLSGDAPRRVQHRDVPLPQPQRYFPALRSWGYGEAIDWRFADGSYERPGPADVWTRPLIPLVAGRPTDAIDPVLIVADSANGVSAVLPHDRCLFTPPTVTVTLHRHPRDDWVNLCARTTLAGDGIGSCLGILSDRFGEIGTVTQPLLVRSRGPHRQAATPPR